MATTVSLKPNAVELSGSTSGTTTLQATAVAGITTLTLPAATDTLVGKATTDTLTNKTLTAPVLTTPALGTPASGVMTNVTGLPLTTGVTGTLPVANGGTGVTTSTGTGAVVLGTSPTIATPTISSLSSASATALTLQSAGTTAVTIDTSQNTTFAGSIKPLSTSGIIGTTTNNNANAGSVGEVVSSSVAVGSAVSITTASTATSGKTVTSISLTAGDWDVFGTIGINIASGTKFTVIGGGINTVTNELNALYEEQLLINYGAGGLVPLNTQTYPIPTTRVSIASTTTYYLIAYAQFTVNTATGYGRITARRMR